MGASGSVKLILDENLSRRIVPALQEAFPGTTQVALAGLERASDREVWEFAKAGGFAIVTKDDDFLGLLSLLGYPPKVVLLTLGNCTNQQVIDGLVNSRAEIEAALGGSDVGLVEVY
jgi:predicted nuclease of predicted toxin-antitoxin system